MQRACQGDVGECAVQYHTPTPEPSWKKCGRCLCPAVSQAPLLVYCPQEGSDHGWRPDTGSSCNNVVKNKKARDPPPRPGQKPSWIWVLRDISELLIKHNWYWFCPHSHISHYRIKKIFFFSFSIGIGLFVTCS